MTGQPPAPRADRADAVAFRDLLRRSSYSRDGIQGTLGISGDVLSRPQERPVHLRRIGGRDGALETLLRLFLLDDPVDTAAAERAFAPTRLETLERLGVVEQSNGKLRGPVRVVPHGEIVLVSDLPEHEAEHADHVAGLHRPSITLADLTVRRPVRAALDVGTGSGIQALLAARHAEHVLATDVNERALAFAELNAALNGITNIEFRAGSFFEPARGATFGLVVCNPPYVISPESAYLFRDSGLGRDRVSERLVGELPGYLEDGGFGTIMASWIHAGPDPAARPREWLAGRGADAWILHTAVEDPLTTAAGWNRDLAPDDARYGAAIDRWLAYYRGEGIDALAYGAIVLRRRSDGPNWLRARELPSGPRHRPEAHLLRLFSGPDASERLADDTALAARRLTLVPGATITTTHRLGADGWEEAAELSLAEGIPFSAALDRLTAEFVVRLDGTRPVSEVLDAFASEHDAPSEIVRASGLAIARSMLELGFATTAG